MLTDGLFLICVDPEPNKTRIVDNGLLFWRSGFKDTVLVIIELTKFAVEVRFRCSCSKLTFCLDFIIMFKNVVHSLEPGETPSNSASLQAPNYVRRS